MRLADLIDEAGSLLAITGAGVSAESGIPTYRGVAGLYNADDGEQIMEALSYRAYQRDSAHTFALLNGMLARCQGVAPNAAHRTLARWQERMSPVTVLTQNVDGLHGEAGSRDVIEMHGNIQRLKCPHCQHSQTSTRDELPQAEVCPACGQTRLRHDVVLFGEMLEPAMVSRYQQAVATRFDLCLVIGTTALFPYIQQAAHMARALGATLVEINPHETSLSSHCNLVLRDRAASLLGHLG